MDTGTSKTHALITTTEGEAIGFGQAGSGNYEVIGMAGFKQAMQAATADALTMADIRKDEICAMGFGFSGYDWPSEISLMVEAIESLQIDCDYQFVNDVELGLLAGSENGWGVAVDAGTGNNIRGRDQSGRIGRITGNSVYFGEIGGAGEMVWLAQIAVTHAWTKRGPKTKLTQCFIDFLEVDSEFAMIEGLATGKLELPSTLAKEIVRISKQGDPVARAIVRTSAQELALNVNAVIRQIGLQHQEFDIVLLGSVFNAGEQYLQPFRQTVYTFAPGANIVLLTVPPVVGALLLAAETMGIKANSIRQKLLDSLEDFTENNFT